MFFLFSNYYTGNSFASSIFNLALRSLLDDIFTLRRMLFMDGPPLFGIVTYVQYFIPVQRVVPGGVYVLPWECSVNK